MQSTWKTHLYRIGVLAVAVLILGSIVALAVPGGLPSSSDAPFTPSSEGSAESATTRTEPAPDFELEQMNGETLRLSDYRGQVVVVNFWATWCPPCRMEIPGFIELQDEFGDDGLIFVGVSLDEQGFDVVRPFAEQMGINYPLVVDDGTVAARYGGVRALPTSFIVDREGQIQLARPGLLMEAELRARLLPLLDGESS